MKYFILIVAITFISCIHTVTDEKKLYASNIIVKDSLNTYFLKNCVAINKNDTLSLKIDATSEMRSDYEIEILKVNNKYFSNCKLTYAVTDCTWKAPVFKSVYQNIFLDKEKYNRGDNLKGDITLVFLDQKETEGLMKLDTIKANGSIKTVVQ